MTSSSTWKNLERIAAKKLGGQRIVRGEDFSEKALDVEHPLYAIDAKYRAAWAFLSLFKKLKADNDELYEYEKKIPILVTKGKRQVGECVIVELDDFAAMYWSLKEAFGDDEVIKSKIQDWKEKVKT